MFWAQIIASIVGLTVQLGVQSWMFTNIPDLCKENQPNGFTVSTVSIFQDMIPSEKDVPCTP